MSDNPYKPAPNARLAELACRAVDILVRKAEDASKITYSDLGEQLGGLDPHAGVPPVLRYLHWHGIVPLGLPMLTAVVVRADTGRPGEAAWDVHWEGRGDGPEVPIGRDVQWRLVLGQVVSFSGWPAVADLLKERLRSSIRSGAA